MIVLDTSVLIHVVFRESGWSDTVACSGEEFALAGLSSTRVPLAT